MDTDRIKVLHITYRDRRIVGVTDHFVLDLLIALDALLHQDLMHRRERQRILHHIAELLRIIGKTAACTAERKCRTQDDRISDLFCCRKCFFNTIGDLGRYDRLSDPLTEFLKEFTVFRALDTLGVGTEKLDLTLFQNTFLRQLHRKVQTRLTADARNDGIRSFETADTCQELERQRLHIDLIRDGCIRHDGGRVRVSKDDLVALFFQCQTGLCTGVVKLRCLSDDDRTRADHEYFMNVCSLRHGRSPRSLFSHRSLS